MKGDASMPKEYADILKELKAPFPKGTVQRNRYIPHQVYVDRLETAAESQWNKEVRELEIRPDLGFVKVVVRVTILDHHREGVGFETIEKDTGGQLRTENAVDLAVARAFVSAVDDWQVG